MRRFLFALVVPMLVPMSALAQGSWPMQQRDIHNTGRSDFVLPASRMNDGLFAAVRWQAPSPGNPSDGSFSATQMVFFDGVGPSGADLVVGTYHWPKGVQGMDRHTGQVFWSGNPAGGESIGHNAAAFAPNGTSIYITNDATSAPLMAFSSAGGPSSFRSNASSVDVDAGTWSPKVLPDGRIFTSNWCDSVLLFNDSGSDLSRVARAESTCSCYPTAAFYQDGAILRAFVASRCGFVTCYDASTGSQLWRTNIASGTDAGVTVDPASGNLYVSAGSGDVWAVGLDKLGQPLWAANRLFQYVSGVNNPQRAQSAGALAHDGQTYYFQTVSQQGDGMLYAVRTTDGVLKWAYPTLSRGGEISAASPIVTPNGVVFVGNNEGRRFFAIRDDGAAPTLIATMDNSPGGPRDGIASASPTLAADGLMYLPMRTPWVYSYQNGPTPTGTVQHVFAAFDLSANPSIELPVPTGVRAFAGNASVRLDWHPITVNPASFSHYAVYRQTSAFTRVQGLTPIATIPAITQSAYTDSTAQNGVHYHYAITSVAIGGGEHHDVSSIGPRTPRNESDLQVVAIRRTPEFPRFDPTYSFQEITEPSGFGPYYFSAATGLGSGQTAATQRWPSMGQSITYTATIRNRGTNPWATGVQGRWLVDGSVIAPATSAGALQPGQTTTFTLPRTWDGASHDIRFELLSTDARAGNNSLEVNSKSVAFLSYVDQTYAENFREESASYPSPATDDMIDWLNNHMRRFNQLFADAGTPKRVNFGVLETLDDAAADPALPTINYAVFPFRYRATDGSIRLSGYYFPADDIDYGLLHEMGHQLGLIDIYQLDTPPERNLVSASGYSAPDCLMRGVSHFISPNSAGAMTNWINSAHGYFGQYLYHLPQNVRVRLLGQNGVPLAGATVRVYQKVNRPDVGPTITNQVKFTGTADAQGEWTLPNVPLNHALVPTTFAGDTLADNPFGYVAVVGDNGVFLLEVVHNGFTDYAWLDIIEVNNAYWAGQTATATFTRTLSLGGGVQYWPAADLAELNATDWSVWAQGGTASAADDTVRRVAGSGSIRFTTDGGFDTYARYPKGLARWDLSHVQTLRFFVYAENQNSFQSQSPWVRLHTPGGLIDLRPPTEVLNGAIGHWVEFQVPLAGGPGWERTTSGTPTLAEVNSVEIHADTWGAGFTLWFDNVRFDPRPCAADFDGSGTRAVQDIFEFLNAWFAGDPRADINGGGLAVQDIFDFLNRWFAGC